MRQSLYAAWVPIEALSACIHIYILVNTIRLSHGEIVRQDHGDMKDAGVYKLACS
jgi:hypothetical protein